MDDDISADRLIGHGAAHRSRTRMGPAAEMSRRAELAAPLSPNGTGAGLSPFSGTVLRLWLLLLVAQKPQHGHELFGALRACGLELTSAGYVYRSLRDLKSSGAVASHWDLPIEGGPAHRRYQITPLGEHELRQGTAGFGALAHLLRNFEAQHGLTHSARGRPDHATSCAG